MSTTYFAVGFVGWPDASWLYIQIVGDHTV